MRCRECQDEMRGRSDKKYCSDACRNEYNNRIYKKQQSGLRGVQKILMGNRKILEDCFENGQRFVRRQTLIEKGFAFNYFTHWTPTEAKGFYLWCFNYGILMGKDEQVLIVSQPVSS